MTQTTKLDMESVRADVQREIRQLREKGIPLTYIKDGKLVREKLLKPVPAAPKKPVAAI
jgi:biotin operon repressor